MIRLEFSLVSDDGASRESVAFDIPQDEWRTLLAFHADTERLRSTKFVQNRRGGQIGISCSKDHGFRAQAKPIDEEEVWAMLMKLRPFVLQRERHYFIKACNILKRQLDHRAFREDLDTLRDGFLLRLMERRFPLRGPGRPPLSKDVVMDWLNAFEYHQDQDKRNAVQVDLGVFGVDQNGLPMILFALVDMMQSILDLGSIVETLMLLERGELSEVVCPRARIASA